MILKTSVQPPPKHAGALTPWMPPWLNLTFLKHLELPLCMILELSVLTQLSSSMPDSSQNSVKVQKSEIPLSRSPESLSLWACLTQTDRIRLVPECSGWKCSLLGSALLGSCWSCSTVQERIQNSLGQGAQRKKAWRCNLLVRALTWEREDLGSGPCSRPVLH